MAFQKWWRKLFARKTGTGQRNKGRPLLPGLTRPTLEELENRLMPATFVPGSIQGQNGWSGGDIPIAAQVDQAVDQSGLHAHSGIGDWRVSNSTINGNYNGPFNGWPFSPGLSVLAGQPSSGAGANEFKATFFFKAASSVGDGSNMEVDLGSSAGDDRNNFLAIRNTTDAQGGLILRAAEPDGTTGNFLPTQTIATHLSRTVYHRIDIVAKFFNGPGNDTFQVSLDGTVLHNPLTGGTTFGTFEGYRDGIDSPYVLTNRLFWRSGASPSQVDPSFTDTGAQGFYFDDISYEAVKQSAPNRALASYTATFEPGRVAFATPPRTTLAGAVSNLITIQFLDGNGQPLNATTNLTITLRTSSASGQFLAANGVTPITSVTILAGTSSVSFRYKDNRMGTPTLSTFLDGLAEGTQVESILATPRVG